MDYKYTVWVRGVEVNDSLMPKDEAETIANLYKLRGYEDVHVERYSCMKAYTDIEQSKKLAKILPLKSADMYYLIKRDDCRVPWEEVAKDGTNVIPFMREMMSGTLSDYRLPCWSLAALIKMLPAGFLLMDNQGETESILYSVWVPGFDKPHFWERDIIDAVYEIICWLKAEEDKNKTPKNDTK